MSRVLVLSAHRGMLDRRIVAQLNELSATGRQVTFVTTPVDLIGSGLLEAVRVVGLESVTEGSRGHLNPGLLKRAYRALPLGIRLLRRDVTYFLKPTQAPPDTAHLLSLAESLDADVIHCHDLETLPAAAIVKAAIAKRTGKTPKLIYDTHELFPFQEPSGLFQRYWLAQERKLIHEADAIVAVNASVADELARLHKISAPVVLYNSFGVTFPKDATARQDAIRRLGVPPESTLPVVLFQGGLTWPRNLKNLVLAFESLKTTANLSILGGGPAEKGIRQLIAARKLSNVSIASWVPPDELLGIVRCVDMGIIPYRGDRCLNDRFCTPNKLFEFMEAGIPICASDLPELRRIVRECALGDVYDMSAPKAIAHAVADCLSRAKAGEFVGLRERMRTEHLRWPAQARTLRALYDRLGV